MVCRLTEMIGKEKAIPSGNTNTYLGFFSAANFNYQRNKSWCQNDELKPPSNHSPHLPSIIIIDCNPSLEEVSCVPLRLSIVELGMMVEDVALSYLI